MSKWYKNPNDPGEYVCVDNLEVAGHYVYRMNIARKSKGWEKSVAMIEGFFRFNEIDFKDLPLGVISILEPIDIARWRLLNRFSPTK